jgi:hypothetical protein
MKTVITHALVATTSLLGACVGVDSSSDDRTLPSPMASAERNGAHVNIYQITPGDLVVVAGGDLPENIEGKTPVEIYEAVAGTPAPEPLVERQAAIAAVQAQHPTDHVGSTSNTAPPARSQIESLTASDFQSQYCNPGAVDFDYCYLNRTDNYVTWFYNVKWVHSHVNCYSGSLVHAIWYRPFLGSFSLVGYDTTTGSSYVSTFNEQNNGDYEISLTSATGDGYHLSMHGDY